MCGGGRCSGKREDGSRFAYALRILWPVVSRTSLEINKKEGDEDRQGPKPDAKRLPKGA